MKILTTATGALAESLRKHGDVTLSSLRYSLDDEFFDLVSAHDVVVHNSARISCGSLDHAMENIALTFRAFKITKAAKRKFVYLSSMSCLQTKNSFKPVEQMSPYAVSKYLGEKLAHPKDPDFFVVRFSTLFYKDPQRDGLSKIINDAVFNKKITIDPQVERDFIPLDAATKILHELIQTNNLPHVLNIASGHSSSFLEVSEFIAALVSTLERVLNYSGDHVPTPFVLSRFDPVPGFPVYTKQAILEYIKELSASLNNQ